MMQAKTARYRVWVIIEFEPSWFGEWGSGLGAFLWGLFALLTTRVYLYDLLAIVIPVLGICLGPLRWVFLFCLRSAPRVILAMLGATWWAWIAIALYNKNSISPSIGGYCALFAIDTLTLCKFSAPYIRHITFSSLWRRKDNADS